MGWGDGKVCFLWDGRVIYGGGQGCTGMKWHISSCHGLGATRWMGGRWEVSILSCDEDESSWKGQIST